MCMEKISGLTKTCGSLRSPLVSFSYFSVFLSLSLSHLIIGKALLMQHGSGQWTCMNADKSSVRLRQVSVSLQRLVRHHGQSGTASHG
jgi:hypothetical protein